MKIYNVENINHYIRDLITNEFKYPLAIKGEMSNLNKSNAGHYYFTLSSGDASISCAFFVNKNMKKLDLTAFDQEEVLIIGSIDFYITKGRFQVIVEDVDIYGEGALKKSIEKTRIKLEAEGIFDNNRPISKYPNKVAVITSPKSDAFKDVCSKFQERYPLLEIILYPVTVQGKNASNEIINQIIKCNHDNEVDVIMLIRGGGSLEDLMPFNEEKMAISIYESKIPIVTGIGHQPDTTIADYAADKAMETPTAAAVYIAPDQDEILQNIDILIDSMNIQIDNYLEDKKNKINIMRVNLERINPSNVIKINKNLYRDLDTRLHNIMLIKNTALNLEVNNHLSRLDVFQKNIYKTYELAKKEFVDMCKSINNTLTDTIAAKKSLVKRLNLEIKSCNPKNVLKKGYSILSDKKGKLLKSTKTLISANDIIVEMHDGKVEIKKNNNKKLLD